MSNDLKDVTVLGDRLLLEVLEQDATVGGVYIPESAKRELWILRVAKVGDGEDAQAFKPGDLVLVRWYIGSPFAVYGLDFKEGQYKVVRPDEIMAKWEGEYGSKNV